MSSKNRIEDTYTWKSETLDGRVYRPDVSISFHTEKACYHADSKVKNEYGEVVNPNWHLMSVNTNKTLGNPAGAFTITLRGSEWQGRLTTNDVAVIQMGYKGERRSTVMVGLIDRVNRKRSIGGDGKPTMMTVVTGRDFGKLLVKDLLKFYPEISGKDASKFFLTDVGWINLMKVFTTDNIMKGTPGVIIDNIMKHIFPKIHDIKWNLWNEQAKTPTKKVVAVEKVLRYSLGKSDFFMPFIFTADQYEGSLWNLMERASPKPFMELFIDTRLSEEVWKDSPKGRLVPHDIEKGSKESDSPFRFGRDGAKVVLCLRETPYESVHFKRLVSHTVEQRDVINEDLSKADDNHFNLFWAGTSINPLGLDLKRVSPPRLNENNAKRYGLSPLEVSIEGMEIKDSLVLEGMSKQYTGKLKSWFEDNHKYWEGSIEIRGRATIKIGQRLIYRSPFEREFYIEGVSQSYNVFEGWTTSLQLTRGVASDYKVDSSKYKWEPPKPKPKKKATASKDKYHKVRRGDTLWDLAKKYYGSNLKWRKIWDANRTMMTKRDKRNSYMHGHWIYPGQKLRIPK